MKIRNFSIGSRRGYAHVSVLAALACSALLTGSAAATEAVRPDPNQPALEAQNELAELADDATLEDYVRLAALQNAELQAAYYAWVAARERVPQARALPDPHVSYGYFIRNVETFTGAQENRLAASQTLPWPGKRRLAAAVATHEANAARERYEARKLETVFLVVSAYAEYYHLGRTIALTRENVDLLKYWEALVRARYRVAESDYPDVVNAQVELGKLDDRLRTLEDLRTPLVARLNELLNRDDTAPLPWPETLPVVGVAVPDEELATALEAESPELAAAAARVAAAEQAIALSKKRYFPNVTVGVEWIDTNERPGQDRPNTGEDPVIATVSVNLPIWWTSYAAGVREAEARRDGARRAHRYRTLDLRARLQRTRYALRDAARKVDLYGNALIPKGREALDANFAAYESGRADFLDLLDAQRVLLEFQLAYERAVADHALRRAELEMLVGSTLPAGDAAESEATS